LPHEAGRASERNLHISHDQIFSRRNTNHGRWRMIIMIGHQNQGV
jgi:hypothetical protein